MRVGTKSKIGERLKAVRSILLFLCITVIGAHALAAPRQKVEVMSGRVIAYSGIPICLNGNAHWSIVIRIEPRKKVPARFVWVAFSLPCEKSPQSVLSDSSIQKFHLIRQKVRDQILEERYELQEQENKDNKSVQNSEISMWTYLPGGEHFPLPFGEALPYYYSIELPDVPVL